MQHEDQHFSVCQEKRRNAASHPGPVDQRLPTELFLRTLSHLPPNDLTLNGRPTCRSAAHHFSQPHHLTTHISQPLPPHYHTSCEATLSDSFKHLPFPRKLSTLEHAAASGSATNLELAWRLLQPSIFPQLLAADEYPVMPAPTAATAGHVAHVLRWLADRGVPLQPVNTLSCVARNAGCSLADLQAAWELLRGVHPDLEMSILVLEAAAASQPICGPSQEEHLGPDPQGEEVHGGGSSRNSAGSNGSSSLALDKMAWIVETGGDRLQLRVETAVAAARSGDLARLEWLRRRVCPFGSHEPLVASLRHAHLCISEWLVREAGCKLPSPDEYSACAEVAGAAAGSLLGGEDAVVKLQWVHAHGIKSYGLSSQHAAAAGNLEAVAYLHEQHGVNLDSSLFLAAAGSGSVPLATWLAARGCATCPQAYEAAARRGDLAMVRWLAARGGCAWDGKTLKHVIGDWPVDAAAVERARRPAWVSATSRGPALAQSNSSSRSSTAGGGNGMAPGPDAELVEAVQLLLKAVCRQAGSSTNGGADGEEGDEAVGNGGDVGGGGVDGGGVDIDGGELMEAAARRGYLPLVLLLHQQQCGCPVGWEVVAAAAAGGCEVAVEWAVGQAAGGRGMPSEAEPEDEEGDVDLDEDDPRVGAYVMAGQKGDAGTLACLRRLGVPWGGRVLEALVGGECKLPVVVWAVEQGARADEEAVEAALDLVYSEDEGMEQLVGYLRGLLPGGGGSGEESGEQVGGEVDE